MLTVIKPKGAARGAFWFYFLGILAIPMMTSALTDVGMYTDAIRHNDASVKSITVDPDCVAITFGRRVKLFGVLPVNIREHVQITAGASGEESVSINKSWWSFLTMGNIHSDKLYSDLTAKLQSESELGAEKPLTIRAQTQFLSDIQASANAVYLGDQ